MSADVQEWVDKQALYELVVKYCRACDRRDFARVRSLYHDDAIDEHGSMFNGSPDDFVAWLPTVMSEFELTTHSVANALFVVNGDRAEGELYVTVYHRTHPPEAKEIFIGGRYLDQYERRRGVWKFLHRSLVLDWCRVALADPSAYDLAGGAPRGRADESDPSWKRLPLLAADSKGQS